MLSRVWAEVAMGASGGATHTHWWGLCAGFAVQDCAWCCSGRAVRPSLARLFQLFCWFGGVARAHARMPARLCFSLGMG